MTAQTEKRTNGNSECACAGRNKDGTPCMRNARYGQVCWQHCDSCHRAVGTKDLSGAVVLVLHSPPGGGYCTGSEQPVGVRNKP